MTPWVGRGRRPSGSPCRSSSSPGSTSERFRRAGGFRGGVVGGALGAGGLWARVGARAGGEFVNCFQHQDRVSVGLCKSCQRGLCPDCAVGFEDGLACRGRCEERVAALSALIERNVRVSPVAVGAPSLFVVPVLFLSMGLIFLVFGLSSDSRFTFAWILGLVLLGCGGIYWAIANRTRAALRGSSRP